MTLTLADLRAELQADPDRAIDLLRALRVAHGWERPNDSYSRRRDVCGDERNAATVLCRGPGRWEWWHVGKREPRQRGTDDAPSRHEAERRCEVGLRLLGWALGTIT